MGAAGRHREGRGRTEHAVLRHGAVLEVLCQAYRDVQEEFVQARSEQELESVISKYIDRPEYPRPQLDIFDRYIGPTDGKNIDRFSKVLENLPNISA